MSECTRNLASRHRGAQIARSVCPYCAVGCGQLVYHKNGEFASIEGDPDSFFSRGRLCPKGTVSNSLLTPTGETRIEYRRPYSTQWEELDLETAMDMIADRVWETRERTFVEGRVRRGRHANDCDCAPWRRHSRQRRKPPNQETVWRRIGHGLHQQSGPHMTQRNCARSGHIVRPRRSYDCTLI